MPTDLRVLLIEDDENDAFLLLKELEANDFNPVAERVQTATELKARLDEDDWDIAISDYKLPNFSGLEALRMVKDHLKDIPCIMVSGKMGEEFAVEAMRLGAEDYILKDHLSRLGPAVERELRDAVVRRQREQSKRELAETRELYRRVVEGANEGISVYADGQFAFVNRAFAKMIDRPVDDIVGSSEVDFFSPADRDKAFEYHRNRMAGRPAPERYETRMVDSQGRTHWMQIAETTIEWKGQKAALAFISDISERKKLEEELRHANEELRAEQENLQRKNIALSEVLERLEYEKKEIERRLIDNVETAVRPILRRLRDGLSPREKADLQSLESAIDEIMSPFMGHLIGKFASLSRRELEVCRMIRDGASTKDIASRLSLAITTISKYRELIRRKLGLSGKDINLATYLQSLEE